MKARIFILLLTLFFASKQFIGQEVNKSVLVNNSTLAPSTGNLVVNGSEIVNDENAGVKSITDINEELRLQLTCDVNSYSDEALVIFNNSDPAEGAAKFYSMYATAPQLWSVKNGEEYSINFMGDLDSAILVPINIRSGAPGNYTITASQVESFGSNFEVSLEDRDSETYVNLGLVPAYTFHVNQSETITDRFFLHFVDLTTVPGKEITTVSEKETSQLFRMHSADGAILITSLQQQSGKIVVFDIGGRKIASGNVDSGSSTQINMRGNKGVYIVSVHSGRGISNTKVLVR